MLAPSEFHSHRDTTSSRCRDEGEFLFSPPAAAGSDILPQRALYAEVAQLVEHLLCKQGVVGSSPTRGTRTDSSVVEQRLFNPIVEGSTPSPFSTPASSNGRPPGFGPGNRGSNPRVGAIKRSA